MSCELSTDLEDFFLEYNVLGPLVGRREWFFDTATGPSEKISSFITM
jgi:hypothetical protein